MNTESDSSRTDTSVSERWRVEGNEHFKRYQASTNYLGRKHHLENAVQSYTEAYKTAENRDEKCSACKNYGTAAWRLVGILRALSREFYRIEIQTRILEAIEFLGKGLSYGAQFKDINWMDGLTALYVDCIEDATTFQLNNLSHKQKILVLEKYVTIIPDGSQRGKCFFAMASFLFFETVEALASKDYKRALNALHDCHRPIHECLRLFRGDDRLLSEVNIIQQDVGFHLATAESLQAIDQGNILLNIAVGDSEGLCMSLLYDAIDWYKKAIILTREVEVEMEACALSHIGHVYDKVLKMKYKAKDYFMRSMQLAKSLQPRNLQCESWFSTCAEALQRYQKESLFAEEERRQKERKVYLKELEKEMVDLKQADDGSSVKEFLKHIYATYPPKNSNLTLDLSLSPKKALLKSILHYHPDKQAEEYGVKWSVLCEEIVKLMTRRYEAYKFDPSTATTDENTKMNTEEEEAEEEESETEDEQQPMEHDQSEKEEEQLSEKDESEKNDEQQGKSRKEDQSEKEDEPEQNQTENECELPMEEDLNESKTFSDEGNLTTEAEEN